MSSRGIRRRRRRRVTQQENRSRAFDATAEALNEDAATHWQYAAPDEEWDSMLLQQAALQPIRADGLRPHSFRAGRNLNHPLEDAADALAQGRSEVPDDYYTHSYDPGEEEGLAESIEQAEQGGEVENNDVERLRKMLGTRQFLNERHRQRQAEITRQATLEMQGSGASFFGTPRVEELVYR
jgi:hypothetical protein